MNPYILVSLVMCGVILIALLATGYMAMYFTRRAKADLDAALAPLSVVLGGSYNVDAAEVSGRYVGKLAFGRMANAEGGPVRVFQTEVIDGAGGEKWLYVNYPAKGNVEFRPEGSPMQDGLPMLTRPDLVQTLGVQTDWFQLEYSPEGGYVRLTVPMGTRKDIPESAMFERHMNFLNDLSNENRSLQERRVQGE